MRLAGVAVASLATALAAHHHELWPGSAFLHIDAVPLSADPSGVEQVWLSLSAAPDAVVVTWVTPLGSAAPASIVQYDVTPGGFGRSATGNASSYTDGAYTSGRIHTATMPGLTAGAAYWYHLSGVNATWSATFTFAAPRGVGAIFPYRLGVVGDLGQTNNSNATIFAILGATPRVDSVVIAGDLSYADGDQPRWDSFGRLAQPLASTVPIMVAPGNHELESLTPFQAYDARYVGMPFPPGSPDGSQYYSYEAGPVHVLILNAFGFYSAGSPQYKFAVADLAAVNHQRTPWVIVVQHTPFYCSNTAHEGSGALMAATFEDAFVRAKVSLVIAGHIHAYERTTNIVGGVVNASGPMHITIGDGGNREGLYTNWVTPQPAWSAYRDAEYGSASLTFVNATHANWAWHRNADPIPVITDTAVIRNVYTA